MRGTRKQILTSVPRSGFLKLLQGALRVRPDGLGAFGIPCGSYIFLNCPTHKRTPSQPFGDESLDYVCAANLSYPEIMLSKVRFGNTYICLAISGLVTEDWMPSGLGYTCTGVPSSSRICRATIHKQVFHGAILPVHPKHMPAVGAWFLQFLLARYPGVNTCAHWHAWTITFPTHLGSAFLSSPVHTLLSLSWMASYGHFTHKPSRGWGTASVPHLALGANGE